MAELIPVALERDSLNSALSMKCATRKYCNTFSGRWLEITVLSHFLCFGVLSSTGCALMKLYDKREQASAKVPQRLVVGKAGDLWTYNYE